MFSDRRAKNFLIFATFAGFKDNLDAIETLYLLWVGDCQMVCEAQFEKNSLCTSSVFILQQCLLLSVFEANQYH